MLEIKLEEKGLVTITGRLDAAQARRAQELLDKVHEDCIVDMQELEYISSAGLGVLLRTHKRLAASGQGLRLVNVNKHVSDIFTYSGFDKLFDIQTSGAER